MPELPEVETNVRHLVAWATGRRITALEPVGSRGVVVGRTIEEVSRRGKWILVRLSGDAGLALHLGMTGKLVRARAGEPLPRFTRAVLMLDDGMRICFVDLRRFGRIHAAPTFAELTARPEIAEVGPDALAVRLDPFRRALASTKRTVKETIMDQRAIAGVGNLYATEALWHARIHPATPARTVAADPPASRALLAGIRKALRQGLREYRGDEPPVYIEEGGDNPFSVYGRATDPCPRCRTKLRSMVLGGRTTAFCPKCQPRRRARH